MATTTRTQETETDPPADDERRLFSMIVLVGTIALAGAGMAFAILLGAYAVHLDTLVVRPVWR
ncbi:MAG TPA: hypothetical protein VH482_25125 [Thermomicrobiales bacterium]|jgi:hypothetical protein